MNPEVHLLTLDISLVGGVESAVVRNHALLKAAGVTAKIVSIYSGCVEFPESGRAKALGDDVIYLRTDAYDVGSRSKKIRSYLQCLSALRSYKYTLRKDAIVISNFDNLTILAVIAGLFLQSKLVAYQHADFFAHGRFVRVARLICYRMLFGIIVLTEFERSLYRSFHKRKWVIPNSIDDSEIPSFETRSRQFVTVCRLTPVKRVEILIEAFAQVAPRLLDWSLKVVGEGSERNRLEAQVESLRLTSRVIFTGQSQDVGSELKTADIYCLTSARESFSISLLEAMAEGLACIAIDCPSGPSQILEGGRHGVLIPEGAFSQFGDWMEKLATESDLRMDFARKARARSVRYMANEVRASWLEFLAGCERTCPREQ